MLDFSSDYTRLAHPRLLETLTGARGAQFLPYGTDAVSDAAKAHIRTICRNDSYRFYIFCRARNRRAFALV